MPYGCLQQTGLSTWRNVMQDTTVADLVTSNIIVGILPLLQHLVGVRSEADRADDAGLLHVGLEAVADPR